MVAAEELREQLRGGWNKVLMFLSRVCLLQSSCFWLPFPSQLFVVGNFIHFSSCASKWFWKILLLQAGNPGKPGSFQLAASQTDFQTCLFSLTWAIKSLLSSPAELKMASFLTCSFTSVSTWWKRGVLPYLVLCKYFCASQTKFFFPFDLAFL